MRESQFTSKLLRELRRSLPSAWIMKFNDQRTGGIPDFCIVYRNATMWFEVKTDSKVTRLQAETLKRIGLTAHIIIWKPKRWEIQNHMQRFICFGPDFKSLVAKIEEIVWRPEL